MEEQIESRFPILTIKAVKPILCKNDRVFAYELKAMTESRHIIKVYENKGLNLTDYLGKKVECLLEITKGNFEYVDVGGKKPSDALVFKYQWQKRLYVYFPELMKIHDDLGNANRYKEHSIQKLFETTTAKCFREWGLNGLNIGVYQDKPVLSSSDGLFLLNEYEFEEVEQLELGQEVYIKIDEAYLRGIRPCGIPKESNQKRQFTLPKQQNTSVELNQKETSVQIEQKDAPEALILQEEPKEQKKRKFFFD